jgi:NAD(P)-dependent dehydrogenase (short-subunit alcohol dehydrogenase family)
MKQAIVITGASSGFGALTARRLADAGHTVYAGMRATTGRNSAQVEAVTQYANEHQVDLRAVEMDVAIDASCDAAIRRIIAEHGHLDVVIHNAGHMSLGPAEAFTPQQFAELYDVNVLSTQRVNRAALPQLRKQRKGLIVSVSSSSTRGGTPPYLSPYFAAKAAMDSLAVSYASELTRWGIEEPADADAGSVAAAIVNVVNTPFGKRPFRVHVDPSHDGAEIVNGVADRVRAEMFRRIGLEDLLHPAVTKG